MHMFGEFGGMEYGGVGMIFIIFFGRIVIALIVTIISQSVSIV